MKQILILAIALSFLGCNKVSKDDWRWENERSWEEISNLRQKLGLLQAKIDGYDKKCERVRELLKYTRSELTANKYGDTRCKIYSVFIDTDQHLTLEEVDRIIAASCSKECVTD